MSDFSLSGHAALVTGSSQGIGLAIATALGTAGARLVCHGLTERTTAVPSEAAYVREDLMTDSGPSNLVAAAFAADPGLDLLVCNAGSFFDAPFLEMTRERWDRTIRLNVTSTYFTAQAFARRLVEASRPGSIVITASTNGFQAEADSTAYDSSKGALVMMIRSLAISLADHGIRVNGIAPGLIRTPLNEAWLETRSADLLAHYNKKILLGRIGAPDDCAGAVVFLCSPAAQYLTGSFITIDGGLTVGQIGKL